MSIPAILLFLFSTLSPSIEGNWSADLKASTLPAGFPQLISQTMELHLVSGKLACSTERVTVEGKQTHSNFLAGFDGKRYPVKGAPDITAVSLRKYPDWLEGDFFSPNALVFSYRMYLSKDGRTLTVVSIDPITRNKLHAEIIYHKQVPTKTR